jgi:hypothetical protein
MNSYCSNNQFLVSGGTITNLASQTNSEQALTGSCMNVSYVNASLHSSNQNYGNPGVSMIGQISANSTNVRDNFVINQFVHSTEFIYQPPDDKNIYNIKCVEISVQLLNEFSNINFNPNEYIFYQQQSDNRIYQVLCEIVPPSFIINFLNKNIYGIETTEQNIRHDGLSLNFIKKRTLNFIYPII